MLQLMSIVQLCLQSGMQFNSKFTTSFSERSELKLVNKLMKIPNELINMFVNKFGEKDKEMMVPFLEIVYQKGIDDRSKEVDDLVLGAWIQYAHYYDNYGKEHYFHHFLGALENIEDYLLERELIDGDGNPREEKNTK